MPALTVAINDTEIGTLEAFEDESQRFTFAESYQNSLLAQRPVLGQIFEDRFPLAISVDGPVCWFAHLLPQGVMRNWQSRLLKVDVDDTFGFLQALGSDLPGAVVMAPGQSLIEKPDNSKRSPPPLADNAGFKFSLAGAQWKLSARSTGRGLTTAAKGDGESWIAKFHAPEFPGLPQCEFATMRWAQQAGLNTPEHELRNTGDFDKIPEEMPVGDKSVFVVKRFDRDLEKRIHMEDFGQILDRPPGNQQYLGNHEELARVIRWIAPESGYQFLRQIVFNIICGNGDAHLKNFSLLYPDTRNAELSPAYDIVSTVLYRPDGMEDLALEIGGSKNFNEIDTQSFQGTIQGLELSEERGRQIVSEAVSASLHAWNLPEIRENFTVEQVERVSRHIASIPLVSGK